MADIMLGLMFLPVGVDNNTMNNSISNAAPQRKNDLQATLNYNRSFGKHTVSALLLSRESIRIYNNDIPYATQGTSFRTTYNYDEKYLFEVNAAYNGSENFAKGHKYGFFPAAALGWVASNEDFLKRYKLINYLKFRGSFGIVGNDQLPGSRFRIHAVLYRQQQHLQSGHGTWLQVSPANVYEGALANPLLTWEKVQKRPTSVSTSECSTTD